MSKKLSKSDEIVECGWDAAITDAQEKIQEAQAKIRKLKKSVAVFQRLRDCGEPFPGEEKSNAAQR